MFYYLLMVGTLLVALKILYYIVKIVVLIYVKAAVIAFRGARWLYRKVRTR